MGRRGPPPTPTRLRVLRGNPSNRPINWNEPKADPTRPRMPATLSGGGRRVWKRTVPLLARMGVLAKVDRDALQIYCETFAKWVDVNRELRATGPMVTYHNDDGKTVRYSAPHPLLSVERKLVDTVRAYQREFGMTPSARTGIDVSKANPNDPASRFFD